ncbi:MAG: type 4a pilus biogenesis protein PilO [Chlamydiae bacterium]|nr:type 4a pilus biogenesis protein PilO [Chlamydiota bacterium]MBI3266602.1 type 4a pilus biogenesis protein PilO [Chlamydiota bacterium]
MTKFMRLYIEWALFFLFVAALFLLIYLPEEGRLRVRKVAMNALLMKTEELEKMPQDIQDVESKIKNVDQRIEVYQKKFWELKDVPRVMQTLSSLFASKHLKVMSILPKRESQEEVPSIQGIKIPLSVELEGHFQDFADMISELEDNSLALTVEDLQIRKEDLDSDLLHVKILLYIFLKKEVPG